MTGQERDSDKNKMSFGNLNIIIFTIIGIKKQNEPVFVNP